ncbi:hypothetical protein [Allomuricauda sp. F6463D]|nr:hypothetical protein [Muricauda sp. F6463D]
MLRPKSYSFDFKRALVDTMAQPQPISLIAQYYRTDLRRTY